MNSEREKLLNMFSAAQFAVWETHIFLDTHPNNVEAMKKLKEFKEKAKNLRMQYEEKFGSITADDLYGNYRTQWLNDPWPWEKEAN